MTPHPAPPTATRKITRPRSATVGKVLTASVALVSLAVLSACGSSSKDSSSGASGAPTGGSYEVAVASDLTGVLAPYSNPYDAGFRTYLNELNARGGVNGKQVTIGVRVDSQGNPTTAVGSFRQAIAANPVALMGYNLSGNLIAGSSVLSAAPFPTINGGVDASLLDKPWFFTPQASSSKDAAALVKKAEQTLGGSLTGKKVTIVEVTTPIYVQYTQLIKKALDAAGASSNVVTTTTTATSFAAQAQQIASAKPDAVIMSITGPIPPVALVQAGYKGPLISGSGGNSNAVLQAVNSPQYVSATSAASPLPGTPIYAAAQKAGEADKATSSFFSLGYASGALLEAGLKKCGKDCTGPQLLKIMPTLTDVQVPDNAVFGPLSFAGTEHAAITTEQFVKWDPAKSQAVPDGAPISIK